jgi:proteasome lid subunit RPN8/RPN11
VRLIVEPWILGELVRHAKACLPAEGCGFLIGKGESAHRFVPVRNVLESSTAYRVEPQVLFDLFRELRKSGEELVAIYHSHPDGPAQPSRRDVASAYYPESAYVIVSLAASDPEIRAYRIYGEEVVEIELHAIV